MSPCQRQWKFFKILFPGRLHKTLFKIHSKLEEDKRIVGPSNLIISVIKKFKLGNCCLNHWPIYGLNNELILSEKYTLENLSIQKHL